MKTLPELNLNKRALSTSVAVGALLVAPLAHAGNLDLHNSTGNVTGTETYESVFVGYENNQNGSLTVSSGGKLTSGSSGTPGPYAWVGTGATATGTVTVDGAGSSWTSNSGWTVIGYHGTGSLTVSNGGAVTTKELYAAITTGASGTVKVTGNGSLLKATSGITIGAKDHAETSTGSLTIENGGAVETVSGWLNLNKNSTLTVKGTGSSLKVGTAHSGTPLTWNDTDGWFTVGRATATISDGATVEADGLYVTGAEGYTGTMSLSGPGTTMDAHLLIYVGGNGNGNGHEGALSLSDGATASASVVAIGEDSGINGTLLLTGAGTKLSSIPNAGTFLGNVYAGSTGNGTITVQNGASVLASNQFRIGYNAGSTGKLIIGAAEGQTAVGSGAVTANAGLAFGSGTGSIIFNHTDDAYTFTPTITGSGSIRNLAGTTSLTGDLSGYTGTLSTEGGTVRVNGTMSNGTATVASGGTLGGTGTLGSLSVASGGTHAPGNSVGTQTVSGAYTLNGGSTLTIEVGTDGQMDKVIVGGAVDLGGATLSIAEVSGAYTATDYSQVILDNQGASAITGTFGSINNALAFYDATVSYTGGTGNDVTLALKRNKSGYTDIATTPNQRSVAAVLTSLPNAGTLLNSILGLSSTGVQKAYTQLSGNIYPTTRQTNVNLNQQVGQQVGGRLANLRAGGARGGQAGLTQSVAEIAGFSQAYWAGSPQPVDMALNMNADNRPNVASTGRFKNGAWTQAVGGRGIIDGDGSSAKTNYDWAGAIGGYDTALTPNLTLGAFFGYINGGSRQKDIQSRVDTDTYTAGVYAEYGVDDWRFNGQAAWSRIDASSTRDLAIGGFVQTAVADYVDNTLSLNAEAAHTFRLGQDVWAEPYVGASALQQFLGNFSETGAGPANLSRASDTVLTGSTRLGVRLSTELAFGDGSRVTPQAGLAWKHHVGSRANSSTLHFASGGPDFVVNGTAEDRNTLVGDLGAAATFNDHWQAFASYAPSVSSNQTEHSFVLGTRYEW